MARPLEMISREVTKIPGVSTSFFMPGHRQSRTAYEHHMGRGPHFIDAA